VCVCVCVCLGWGVSVFVCMCVSCVYVYVYVYTYAFIIRCHASAGLQIPRFRHPFGKGRAQGDVQDPGIIQPLFCSIQSTVEEQAPPREIHHACKVTGGGQGARCIHFQSCPLPCVLHVHTCMQSSSGEGWGLDAFTSNHVTCHVSCMSTPSHVSQNILNPPAERRVTHCVAM
jgi:hypothetical protein